MITLSRRQVRRIKLYPLRPFGKSPYVYIPGVGDLPLVYDMGVRPKLFTKNYVIKWGSQSYNEMQLMPTVMPEHRKYFPRSRFARAKGSDDPCNTVTIQPLVKWDEPWEAVEKHGAAGVRECAHVVEELVQFYCLEDVLVDCASYSDTDEDLAAALEQTVHNWGVLPSGEPLIYDFGC